MTEPEGEVIIINQYCTSARDNYNEFISHEAILRMRSCAARGTVHTVRSDVLLMLQVARHFSLLTRNQNRLEGVLPALLPISSRSTFLHQQNNALAAQL